MEDQQQLIQMLHAPAAFVLTIGDSDHSQGMPDIGVGFCSELELIVQAAVYLSLQSTSKRSRVGKYQTIIHLGGCTEIRKALGMSASRRPRPNCFRDGKEVQML